MNGVWPIYTSWMDGMPIENQHSITWMHPIDCSRCFLVHFMLCCSITNAIAVRFNLLTMAWQPEEVPHLPCLHESTNIKQIFWRHKTFESPAGLLTASRDDKYTMCTLLNKMQPHQNLTRDVDGNLSDSLGRKPPALGTCMTGWSAWIVVYVTVGDLTCDRWYVWWVLIWAVSLVLPIGCYDRLVHGRQFFAAIHFAGRVNISPVVAPTTPSFEFQCLLRTTVSWLMRFTPTLH